MCIEAVRHLINVDERGCQLQKVSAIEVDDSQLLNQKFRLSER